MNEGKQKPTLDSPTLKRQNWLPQIFESRIYCTYESSKIQQRDQTIKQDRKRKQVRFS